VSAFLHNTRHPREAGDPFPAVASRRNLWRWIPALAGMTMVVWLLVVSPSFAQDTMPPAPYAYRQLDDPAQEARAQALMETLRCLKCQSQSIADSDAPMAGDMRSQVRQRIAAGEDPEAIRGWLVERYGDYVSYAPRVTGLTWPLFVIPLLLLVLAAALLRRRFRKGDAA
jgi:cytochrome c-type biogenesis protein CcmH/NrfF